MNTLKHIAIAGNELGSDEQMSLLQVDEATLKKRTDTLPLFMNDNLFNIKRYFFLRFGKLFNVMVFYDIDSPKINSWIQKEYKDVLESIYTYKSEALSVRKKSDIETIFVLKNEMIILLNEYELLLLHADSSSELAALTQKLPEFVRKHLQREIYILTGSDYLRLNSVKVNPTKLNIHTHYNDDFEPVHKVILKRLNKKNDKGLVLLHGLPGTGKTTYLRYLVGKVNKKVVFLPPELAVNIARPDFMELLLDNPNSILVIEDAENIITDRSQTQSSAISTLLNLSDGLLSDCLNIQIICTFNTQLSSVDSALLRKGRLIAKYEFGELIQEKAQKLSESLNFFTKITKSMRLCDIYNQEEQTYEAPKSKIGFR
ncbi:AAA family ATPase [Cytophagaceae bacterium DM2B3-1]|uniref:AAA family ATPase n=1 Tax=Xanthocytophaga flava TaxID=3048013 RepID=A0ABT7CD95_9BACT|nr:AAA family ATPase [Xanthocytophaga flavus]MDJ1471668.1 AAA family ATPase [Xanthocytophaga flavus]MDJ1491685.1 AAA family ATPase [Xanthocytophaga flavus]